MTPAVKLCPRDNLLEQRFCSGLVLGVLPNKALLIHTQSAPKPTLPHRTGMEGLFALSISLTFLETTHTFPYYILTYIHININVLSTISNLNKLSIAVVNFSHEIM